MYKLSSFYCTVSFQFDTFVLLHIPIVVMIIALENFNKEQYVGDSMGEVQVSEITSFTTSDAQRVITTVMI